MLNHYLRKVPIADSAKGLLRSGRNAEKNDFYCVRHCPVGALSIKLNPSFEILGDYRWTGDLILSARRSCTGI